MRIYIKDRALNTSSFGALLCFALFSAACVASKQSDQTVDSAAEKQAIEKTLSGMIEAANGGDIESVLSYFEESAVAMPIDEMLVFGTRLIRPSNRNLSDILKEHE